MIEFPGTVLGSTGSELSTILEEILIIVISLMCAQQHSAVLWEIRGITFDANRWGRRVSISPGL